jgi:HK97 gp10 family phage protein
MALEGVRELDAQLAGLSRAVRGRVLRTAVRAAIGKARERAEATIPTGTVPHRTHKGRLVAPGFAKRNIRVAVRLDRTREKATGVLGVDPEAFYAVQFVELGTVKVGPRPWLRPAFNATLAEQQRELAARLRRSLLAVAQRRSRATR